LILIIRHKKADLLIDANDRIRPVLLLQSFSLLMVHFS